MKASEAWKKLFEKQHIKEHYYEKKAQKTAVFCAFPGLIEMLAVEHLSFFAFTITT